MTPSKFSEDALVERPALALLESLGYEIVDGFSELLGQQHVGAGGLGRDDQSEVILRHRLRPKLEELNPGLPPAALDAAVEAITLDRSVMEATRANQAVWQLLRDGAKVTFTSDDGERVTETLRFVDWWDSNNNDHLAVSQF